MNNSFLQNGLMAIYKLALRLGLLRWGPGRIVYEWAYDIYKQFFEAKHINQLAAYVRPATTVIDIGANTGFFTVRFCQWVGPQGRVIAVEPEAENLKELKRRLENSNFNDRVDIIQAAVADTDGEAFLKINPDHPGDHRLAEQGIPIELVSLDRLLDNRDIPTVSLVKIDVQGAETKVIEGARAMLAKHRPTLFVEIDESALHDMDTSAYQLLVLITGLGYTLHTIDKDGPSQSLSIANAMDILTAHGSYIDFLFLSDNVTSTEDRT